MVHHEVIESLEHRGKSSKLIVFIHAFSSSPEKLSEVRDAAAGCEEFRDADFLTPRFPAGLFSRQQPNDIVRKVLKDIDAAWAARPNGYQEILFVGHSLGALIARKVFICACGASENLQLEPELRTSDLGTDQQRDWYPKIKRLVLLAGMNRGWRVNHHLELIHGIQWRVGVWVAAVFALLFGKAPLIMSIRKGAPFLTQLRLQWIGMQNGPDYDALTIQLLGTVDDMVSPEDNIDLAAGRDFIYLDVPYSGHGSVIRMSDPAPLPHGTRKSPEISTIGAARAEVFRAALVEHKEALQKRAILPSDLPLGAQDAKVTDVIFVIHGIRDRGYWTHKIARHILRRAQQEQKKIKLKTETSSYGYFPMLPFLLPSQRQEKTEWLMDQFAEAKALYPRAEFSFVGHSNGTYLLAKAIKEYPI